MRGKKAKALRRACTTGGVLNRKEYREVKRGTGSIKRFADEIIKAARSGKAVSVPDGEVATEKSVGEITDHYLDQSATLR